MTNLESFIFESLKERAVTHTDFDKVDCLINHYQQNIAIYENVVTSGVIGSPVEIVDNDYYNINLICLSASEKVSAKKVEEVKEYYNKHGEKIMFIKDESSGEKYLYSFSAKILDVFAKEDLLAKGDDEDEII